MPNSGLGAGIHPNNSHIQQHPQHMRQIVPIQQNRSAEPQHHHYLVAAPTQPAYDPEAALINTIVSHLANLNDDEVGKCTRNVLLCRFSEGSDEDEHPKNPDGRQIRPRGLCPNVPGRRDERNGQHGGQPTATPAATTAAATRPKPHRPTRNVGKFTALAL